MQHEIMKRKKEINKVSAILTSDWHLREDTPVCRTDDFWETQWGKVNFISDLQKEHDCCVIHAGDLFDFWKPSPMLLSKTIEHLPNDFYTIYGNHDLPQHNLENAYKCGVYTLHKAQRLYLLNSVHWLQNPKSDFVINSRKILTWHTMTYQGKRPYPGCKDPRALGLLKKYPEYDLILTGHNHKPFVEELDGRLLVNPGSIFRMDTDQMEHKPRVYLWNAETNEVTAVYLPIQKDVISREHLEKKQERDNRIDAFVSSLNQNWDIGKSFEESLEKLKQTNDIPESVMQIVYEAIRK